MATLATLAVKLTTNINEFTGGLHDASSQATGFASKLERNWGKITAGGVAAGGAIMKLTGDSLDYNKSLRAMERQTGMTEKEQRSMIRELTDASFAHDDAVRGMERLIQAGATEEEQFRELLPVFDTLADALGIDITDGIHTMDGALSALGVPLDQAGEHMDTLTFLAKNSTADFHQLGTTFRREQANIREMGLSFDDVAVALAAVEAEGIKGPRAVMELQNAMQDAEGDAHAFWQELGVTNETLDTQRQRLSEAAGMTEELADINNQSLTWWDELTHTVKDYGLELGTVLEPARDLGPVLMGLGPAIKAVSVAKGIAAVAAGGLWAALVPLLPVILPLVAIAGILFLAWKNNWGDIQGVTADAIEWLTGALDTFLDWISGAWETFTDFWSADTDTKIEMVSDAWGSFTDWLSDTTQDAVEAVGGFFSSWADAERERFATLTGNLQTGWGDFTGWLSDNTRTGLDTVRGFFSDNRTEIETTTNGMWDAVRGLYETQMAAVEGVMRGGIQIMQGDWRGGLNTLRDTAQEILPGLQDVFRSAMDAVAGIFNMFGWEGTGQDITRGIVDGIRNGTRWLTDAARNAARQALNAMKSVLGISSPSKVFRNEIGEMLPLGAALGVEDGMPAATRRIASAFDDMVGRVAPVVGGMGEPASAMGGISISVQVSGADASYENGRETGRGIADELRARGLA